MHHASDVVAGVCVFVYYFSSNTTTTTTTTTTTSTAAAKASVFCLTSNPLLLALTIIFFIHSRTLAKLHRVYD